MEGNSYPTRNLDASYADRKGHATSLRPIAVRCKAGDIQRCFSLAFDCKCVSSCIGFNTDAKGKTCDPRDLERQPGFTQKYSRYPGPSVLPNEVLCRGTYQYQADCPGTSHEDTTFAFAHALLDNVHQLALQGNDVQAFTPPAFNWQQLCRHRNTRTLIHLSVSSLQAEEKTVLCRTLVELRIVHAFHGSYIVAYVVSEVCLIRYAFEPLKTTSTFQ